MKKFIPGLNHATYIVRPEPITAVLLTKDNISLAAIWCGGEVIESSKEVDSNSVSVHLKYPSLKGNMSAYIGEFLCCDDLGRFFDMPQNTFESKYVRKYNSALRES